MSLASFGKALVIAAVGITLAGCSANMDELDAYVNDIKARPGGRIDPLPEITPYEIFVYRADIEGLRSPFLPDTPQAAAGQAGGIRPDADRIREYLESFSLDTMDMVGTLDLGGTTYGLVQDADGLIHRVVPGNYLGQNDGRIVSISASAIEIVEIISDGIGGYVERDAAISLSD